MALVTMAAVAATPACGVLQSLSVRHEVLRCIVPASGTTAVSFSGRSCNVPRRIFQATCDRRTRIVSRNGGECTVRVERGEKVIAMAQTPEAVGAESVSMENFESVEELKAALLDSLEGAHHFQVAFRCC